jgi:hypothetical protein
MDNRAVAIKHNSIARQPIIVSAFALAGNFV